MQNFLSPQGAFIARIFVESLQSRWQRRIMEAGFSGQKKDKLGHTRYYQDGRQVKNPNAKEKADIHAAASQPLPAGQAPSHNDAATRVAALDADTPPEHVKALANDLMKMSTEDLAKMAQAPAEEEPKQKRANAGGEVGPNGEHYKGGAFIATTEMPKSMKDKIKRAAGDGMETVRDLEGNVTREKPPHPGLMSISGTMMGTLIGRKGEVNEQALDYLQASPEKRKQVADLAEKYRAGEHWAPINDYPNVALGKHIYQLAAAGLPIAGSLLGRLKNNADFQKYYKKQIEKTDATPAPAAPAVKPTASETKAAATAEKTLDSGNQSGIGEAGDLVSLDTDAINVDPTRFQYKLKLDSTTGAGDNLKNVSKFNSLFAGVVHAWKDPADGKIYVVNGHHRMELARRAGHKKMNVQMIIAPNATVARSTGALINMAEGRGTAIDAAKYLRDSKQEISDLKGHGVSLKEKVVDDAMQLKDLSERIFSDLTSGILDTDKAVAIGKHLKDHRQQEQLYNHYLEQREKHDKDFNAATLAQAALDISRTPTQQGGGQMDLFGNTDDGKSLFLEKAELKTKIRNLLSQEVSDYAMAGNARRAKNIASAGNILQVDTNKDKSKEADRLKQAYDQFQHLSGPVADAINNHVEEYANVRGSKKAVVEKALSAVRTAIRDFIEGGNQSNVRAGGENPQGDQGTGRTEPEDLPADVRDGNAQDVDAGPSLFGNAQDEEPQAEKPKAADEPGFTGIDAEGREWRNGELVAAKDEEPAPQAPSATPEPSPASPAQATTTTTGGLSDSALTLDAMRLKTNRRPHNAEHLTPEKIDSLKAQGFVDADGKMTDAGREHLYTAKGKKIRKATGPKVLAAMSSLGPYTGKSPEVNALNALRNKNNKKKFEAGHLSAEIVASLVKQEFISPAGKLLPAGYLHLTDSDAPAPAPTPPIGTEKYFGTGGDHVTVTLKNGTKAIIPAPMESVPGWDESLAPVLAAKSFYNLSESEVIEHREAQELIRREWPKFRQDYLAKMGTFDPKTGELLSITCNCDDWRDQFPNYIGTNSGTIHDAASYANMRMLNEAMALMKGKGNNQFLVLGGGGGSGKGTATKDIIKASDYPVVLDSVSDDSEWTKTLMNMAKSHGYGGQFVFIDRAPQDAWKDGVVKRAMESRAKFDAGDKSSLARTVPLSVALPANLKARKAAFELLQDGSVPTMIINNNLGFGKAREVVGEEAIGYLQKGNDGYNKEELLKELEDDTYGLYEQGKIPDDIATGLISAKTIAARRLQPRSTGGSDSGGPPDGRGANTDSQGTSGQAPLDGGTSQGSSSAGKSGETETDFSRQQEIKNSLDQGELIIKSGKNISGKKYSTDELNGVIKSVNNEHAKLGQPGFTGIDAEGREWQNGELVAAKDEEPAPAAQAEPQAKAPDEQDNDRSMPEHEAVRQVYLMNLPKTTTDQVLRRLDSNIQFLRSSGKVSGSNAYTQNDINQAVEEVLERKQITTEFKKNLDQALKSQNPKVQSLIQERNYELQALAQAKEKKGFYGTRMGEDSVRRLIRDANIKVMNLSQKIVDQAAKAPATNTDLFGNPSKTTSPKGPETMPGLFGDAVPIAPDAPTTTDSNPLPGSDNPLDRAGAGRGRQDATQDMFGLFGPATKNKIAAVNNAPDADPVTTPSTPAAAAAEPQPGDTPRTQAARVSAAIAGDFENARASTVPNMGQDTPGSARHKAIAWKGLKDAEANGTAEALVKRDELLKHNPSNLSAILAPENFLGVLTSHLAMQTFPKEVLSYGKYTNDEKHHVSTPEQLREQYYEAFVEFKKLTEDLSTKSLDPRKIASEVNSKLQELIKKFRKEGQGEPSARLGRRLDGDRFNPVANSLVNMQQRILGRGANSVIGRVNDFGKRLFSATGEISYNSKEKAVSTVADILEGKSFNQAFNTVEKKEKDFDYNEAYGGQITRTGGKKIDMNEQSTSAPGAKVFMDDMKVRGVQFGNSLPDAERVYHAEKVAESLSDLTGILGLPDEAAGLGGKLGLAIGARGKGGALAHFEPYQANDRNNADIGGPVINLTRANGAGSLAHEWGHGLDHFAANNKPGDGKFLSHPEATSGGAGGSPETIKAMKKVQEAMGNSGFSDRLIDETVRRKLSSSKRQYWTSPKEKFARTFERYVQNKLHEAGRENTYLTGLHKQGHPLWPTNSEMEHIAPHMDALITAIAAEKFPSKTTEAVKPAANNNADKIKLVQAIIARRGLKPPQPKSTPTAKKIPEASDDADPRVKKIREIMKAYC